MTDTHSLSPDAGEGTLDACGFMPNLASRILGLGGPDASSDPAYAFHTPYAPCNPGRVTFTLRPLNLRATKGNLTVRINAISTAPNAVARTIKMASRPLRDLSFAGEMQISLKAKPNLFYAVVGLVYGATDATADDLEILVHQAEDAPAPEDIKREANYSTFGTSSTMASVRLLADTPAKLAEPVSQVCTPHQIQEAAYSQIAAEMHLPDEADSHLWQLAYVRSVLGRYGMAQPGARGLGLGVDAGPLPAALAARGCCVVAAASYASPPLDRLRHPEICPADRFDDLVSVRLIEAYRIDSDLRDFDFCWSTDAVRRLGSLRDAIHFLMESLLCLKVGGIAVHTVPFEPWSEGRPSHEDRPLFRRNDIERLAFDVVSLGHQIAQINYGGDEGIAADTIGLVFRRGESTFY